MLRRREKVLRELASKLTDVETMDAATMRHIIEEVEGQQEPPTEAEPAAAAEV